MHVTITDTSPDGLQQEQWTFWVTADSHFARNGIALVLDTYTLGQRPTTRHKHRAVRQWERLGHRRRVYGEVTWCENPPLPDDVVARAKAQVAASIQLVVEKPDKAKNP